MEREFGGSRFFGVVPVGALRDEKILNTKRGLPLLIEIVTMLNATGEFYMSNNTLAQRLYCTPQTIDNCLRLLEDRGYIKREKVYKPGTKQVIYRNVTYGPYLPQAFAVGWSNQFDKGSQTDLGTGSQMDLNRVLKSNGYKYNNVIEQDNKTNKKSSGKPETHIPYKEIIDYLNQITGKHYRSTTGATKDLIKARWNEGFRLDDFKKVIDIKASHWLNDEKMSNYLQPSTLFSRNHFETYLNQKPNAKVRQAPSTGFDADLLATDTDDDNKLPF